MALEVNKFRTVFDGPQSLDYSFGDHSFSNTMNQGTVRNVLAPILGFLVGGVVNMGLIITISKLVPPPAGVDVYKAESIAENIHRFELKHYVAPFVAHAAGTFVGALAAYLIGSGPSKRLASYIVGSVFLAGGIYACSVIPAPAWFMVLDVVGAYIPMAIAATVAGAAILKKHASSTKKSQ